MTYIEQALTTYIILAIGYNLVSQLFGDIVKKKLAPTEPTTGVLIMAVVYLWFRLALSLSLPVFVLGAIGFIYLIGRFGIFQHMISYSLEGYYSRLSWSAAILINIFGIVVLLIYLYQTLMTA